MTHEDIQLIDKETTDNSITKRDFVNLYFQQGAQLNNSDQNIEFNFRDINKYHQIGNAYLQ